MEGADPLARGEGEDAEDGDGRATPRRIADAADRRRTIDLAAGARYRATGKRKTASPA